MAHEPDGVLDFGATPSTTIGASGTNFIDALVGGTKWVDADLTFSFPDTIFDFGAGYPDDDPGTPDILGTFSTFSVQQQTSALYWLDQFDSVSGLSFTELDGTPGDLDEDQEATIRFMNSQDPGTAYAYFPNSGETGGDIWMNPTSGTGGFPTMGNFDWSTMGHELGHALGLDHGHTGGIGGPLPAASDSLEFSIMTYRSFVGHDLGVFPFNTTETFGAPQSLMMYDIAAIQYIYGADFTSNSGDTTYSFSTTTGEMFIDGVGQGAPGANRVFRTIWDGDGNDAYNFSNYTTTTFIDLRAGNYTNLHTGGNNQRADLGFFGPGAGVEMARGHVFNALQFNGDDRSLIENAYGGTNDDIMVGNQVSNVLQGNNGDDELYGEDGDDFFFGGNGNDQIVGGNGSDWYLSGTATAAWDIRLDFGYANGGGQGNDTIFEIENAVAGDFADIIVGNGLNNELQGRGGADQMWGGAGDDRVFGEDGDDILQGNDGNDFVSGGNGADTIFGQAGDDTLYGGGSDGADGIDTVYGGDGNDYISGGFFVDILFGGAGNDTFALLNNDFFDTIDGGADVDTVNFAGYTIGGVTVDLNAGFYDNGIDPSQTITAVENVIGSAFSDTITGDANANVLTGGDGNDNINGLGGDDEIYGGDGDDVIEGAGGDDDLFGGAGDDRFVLNLGFGLNDAYDGGTGADTFDISAIGGGFAPIDINLDTGVAADGTFSATLTDIENVLGSGSDELITGDGNVNMLVGNGGDDVLNGGSGIDDLFGGDGNDLFLVTGSDFGANVDGGAGTDTFDVSGFTFDAYEIDLGAGFTKEAGLSATQTIALVENVVGTDDNDTITGDANANVLTGGDGDDLIYGEEENDVLYGGAGVDAIYGGDSDDFVEGGLGDDTLDGGAGIDSVVYVNEGGGVVVDFSAGTAVSVDGVDQISEFENVTGSNFDDDITTDNQDNDVDGGSGDDRITLNGGADQGYGADGDDFIYGGAGGDVLNGEADNDRLFGGAGADLLFGGSGDDRVVGGLSGDELYGEEGADDIRGNGGADTIYGGLDDDIITAGGGKDTVFGGDGADNIVGAGGADVIDGGDGDDVIAAQNGSDTITGGFGADTFVFDDSDKTDTILDFENGIDLIDVSLSTATGFGDLMLFTYDGGLSTRIEFDSTKVKLDNVLISDVDASDFIF